MPCWISAKNTPYMCYIGESWHTLINQALSKFEFIIPNVIEEWYNPVTLLSSPWKFTIPSGFPEGVNDYPEFLSSAIYITPSLALPIKYSIWDVKIRWINQLCDIRADYIQILPITSKNWLWHSWEAQRVTHFLSQNTYIFGRLSEHVSHTTTISQALV